MHKIRLKEQDKIIYEVERPYIMLGGTRVAIPLQMLAENIRCFAIITGIYKSYIFSCSSPKKSGDNKYGTIRLDCIVVSFYSNRDSHKASLAVYHEVHRYCRRHGYDEN